MKHSVKFKAITYKGDVIKKTVKVDCPEFKEYFDNLIVNGKELSFKVSVEDQVMTWLDNTDKSGIMDKNEWYTILDYSVPKKVVKQTKAQKIEKVKSMIEDVFGKLGSEHSTQLRDDFMIVYIKMFDKINKLTPDEQFLIVLGTMDVAYTAQSEAYKHAIKLIQSIGDKDLFAKVHGSKQRVIR